MGKTHKFISFMLCMVMILSLIFVPNDSVNAATKVKINKKSTTIYVGKTVQLKVTGTKKKVAWSSSNKKIATVTSKGKVKGVKKGKVTITAKVDKKKYTCKVTVKEKVTTTPKPTKTETPKITPTPKPSVKPTTTTPTLPPVTPTPPVGSIPTPIPTKIPDVNNVSSNFLALKKYITQNGKTNSSGNKFISDSLNDDTFGIIYDASNSTYSFIISGTNNKLDYALNVDIKEVDLVNGEVKCALIYSDELGASLDTTSNLKNINGDSNLNWTVDSNTSQLDDTWMAMADTILDIGYLGWDALLYSTLKLNIKDFGFGVNNNIEPTTIPTQIVTNPPIIITPTPVTTVKNYDYTYVSGKYTELKDYIDKNGEELSSTSKYIEDTKILPNGEKITYNIQYHGRGFTFVAHTDSFHSSFDINVLNSNYSKINVTSYKDNYMVTSYFETSNFLNEYDYLNTLEWTVNVSSFNNETSKNFEKEIFSLSVNYCEQMLNEKVNMSLKDLGIGTGSIYITNTITPPPLTTPRPTATPKPQTLEGRYDVVKKYFEENNTKFDNDVMCIKGSVEATKNYKRKEYKYNIAYSNKTNDISVLVECEYVKCNFNFNTLISDKVNAEYRMLRWEPRYCGHEAVVTFNASEFNTDTILSWETTGTSLDEIYTPDNKDINKSFHEAYEITNWFFVEHIGLSLEDLGFGTNVTNTDE